MNTKQLRLQREVVAVEAFAVSDVAGLLKKIFPVVTENFGSFVGMFDTPAEVAALSPSHRKMSTDVVKHQYIDMADLTAYKPPGLSTNYLVYLEALEPAVEHVIQTLGKLAPEFTLLLSRLINQEDYQRSSIFNEAEFKKIEKKREDILKMIGNNFKKGATDVKTTVGNVVSRNADWNLVFNKLEMLNTGIAKVDRKNIARTVKDISDLMDALKTKISNGEMKSVSPEIVRYISEGAYQLASEIELYSVIHYRLLELSGTVNQTVDHFITSTKH